MPFDLLYWNSDSTRMPAANHSYYLRNCYLENNLSNDRMVLDGKRILLGDITIPVYNLATREDHIAPAKSVFVGCRFFGGKVTYVMSGSGHIAGVVNPPDKKKYQYWTRRQTGRRIRPLGRQGQGASGVLVAALAGLDRKARRRDG